MMINLTNEQSDALRLVSTPVRIVDPATKTAYVLLTEESFQNMAGLLADGPLSSEERRAILSGVWKRADWDDPSMDEYASLLEKQP